MVINHNLSAMFANRQVYFNELELNKDIEKLSTGMRINRGGDDASGLAVSEKLRSQIRGLNQAGRNIESAVSFIQTTEGYLAETQDIMHRVRELAVQSANGIYTDEDRAQIQVEVSQLVDEVNRIASHAQFNGLNMLTGRFANPSRGGTVTGEMFFQVGANMDQRKQVFIGTMTAQALGCGGFRSPRRTRPTLSSAAWTTPCGRFPGSAPILAPTRTASKWRPRGSRLRRRTCRPPNRRFATRTSQHKWYRTRRTRS